MFRKSFENAHSYNRFQFQYYLHIKGVEEWFLKVRSDDSHLWLAVVRRRIVPDDSRTVLKVFCNRIVAV